MQVYLGCNLDDQVWSCFALPHQTYLYQCLARRPHCESYVLYIYPRVEQSVSTTKSSYIFPPKHREPLRLGCTIMSASDPTNMSSKSGEDQIDEEHEEDVRNVEIAKAKDGHIATGSAILDQGNIIPTTGERKVTTRLEYWSYCLWSELLWPCTNDGTASLTTCNRLGRHRCWNIQLRILAITELG